MVLTQYNFFHLKWFGDGSEAAKQWVNEIIVRDTTHFHWTFIFILAVVFYVYWSELHKKNYEAVFAGLALYAVHWLYEIMNAIIGKVSGYPLWAVSNDTTSFILLVGVSWELSMMFSIAGIISYKMMGPDKNKRYFTFKGKYKGLSTRFVTMIEMALLFALFEAFLAGLHGGDKFIWVYPWWGVLPVFITTYVPFFLASNYINCFKPKVRNIILISAWGLVFVLLCVLIPLQVI